MTKLFEPASGSAEAWFQTTICSRCRKWPLDSDAKNQCTVFLNSISHTADEKDHPRKWIIKDDKPHCLSFESRDDYNASRRKGARSKQDSQTGELFG